MRLSGLSHRRRKFMTRVIALSLLVVLGGVSAAHSQMSLDSDVCYVQYQVTIKADQTAGKSAPGEKTVVTRYESVWENTVKLDLRSPGQVLSMLTGNQLDPAKLQHMTPA